MEWKGGKNKSWSVIHRKRFWGKRKGRGKEVVKTQQRGSLLKQSVRDVEWWEPWVKGAKKTYIHVSVRSRPRIKLHWLA